MTPSPMTPADLWRLLTLSALWGGSFIFIRLAAPVLGPVALVEARVLIAGLTLFAYARLSGARLELSARWPGYLALGLLNSAVPFVLISTAELHLSASFAAILNATSPLFGAAISAVWLGDRLTASRGAGMLTALLGVAVLVGWSPVALEGTVLASVGASLLGAAFYGLAGAYTRARLAGAPPLGMAVGSQLGAAGLLVPALAVAPPLHPPSATVALCVLALALACTALAYGLYFRLVVDLGPTRALSVTFLTPLFGVAWGALFLNEPVTGAKLVGCAVILAGTGLVTGVWGPRPPQPSRAGAGSRR